MYAELHPDASAEFAEYAVIYEIEVAGLGRRFIEEIERGIEILLSQPQIGRQLDDELRCFVLGDFPFSLIYQLETDRIWIVAVSHHSRRPGYWRERLDH
jgi:toxin ParE1/3/4